MVATSTPAPVLFCEAMQGDDGRLPGGRGQFATSPSNSLLAELNADVVPSAVVNDVAEPQQMLKCEEPGGWFCCTRFLGSIIVIVFDRLVAVKVRTPPPRNDDVHDRAGKPPPVAASTSLVDAVPAAANPEVPAELTVSVWQALPCWQCTSCVTMSN